MSERGVEAVELAIALPVFLMLLFGSIDMGRMVSGYSTVRAAVATGARQAVGLQRKEWQAVNTAMGNATDSFVSVAAFVAQAENLAPEFVSTVGATNANWYLTQSLNPATQVDNIFRLEARAIAYANVILARSAGNLEYPCTDRPSCVACFTVRGSPDFYKKYFSAQVGGQPRVWTANMLGISCSYNVPITSTLIGMGILPSFVTVTARVYVPINNYTSDIYDPGNS